jgi:hypothetical protein
VKYLRLDPHGDPVTGAPVGALYRLPDDTDLEEIADHVAEALASNGSVRVALGPVGKATQTRSVLVINGSLVRQVLVGEAPEGGLEERQESS